MNYNNSRDKTGPFARVLKMRKRNALVRRMVENRLDTVLPMAMRENNIDMWIILCQEDNLDPVFSSMMPSDTWFPILQILVLHDRGDHVDRVNLSMTNTHGLFEKPWKGHSESEQWEQLRNLIANRRPRKIGINTGSVQWAAGALTVNLHGQLLEAMPTGYAERLVSAEPLATRFLATLTDMEIEIYEHVASTAHAILAECYSRKAIIPGVTTIEDLRWYYRQLCADLALQVSFKPFFFLLRSDKSRAIYGDKDQVIRHGDFVRSDVGIRYLRLNSDHQQWSYILRPGESDAPAGMRALMAQGNKLQDIFMGEFRCGLPGNELLKGILRRARKEGLPKPRVYSHSLGLFLHEPGPLIGLPWEQEDCSGRGDVTLQYNYAFTAELSVTAPVNEWSSQEISMSMEEDVVFTEKGCRMLDGRQTGFYLV